MANLSFTAFINQYLPDLQKDPDFAEFVKIANVLVKKYNRSIFLGGYKQAIQKENQKLWNFIEFLGKFGFWNKDDLNRLSKEIEKKDQKVRFTLQAPIASQKYIHSKVDDILNKEFSEYNLKDDENSALGITIKGNGYHYKRNINSDLDILLK